MPLSANVERELVHTRTIESWGYRRSDGLWDVEAAELLCQEPGRADAIAFHPVDPLLAVGMAGGDFLVVHSETGEVARRVDLGGCFANPS